MEWWDACVDSELRPVVADRNLPVWVGVDASVKRDSTAIVATTWDEQTKRVRLVWHRIFQPTPNDPLDFEATIEQSLTELSERFEVKEIRYDPYQLIAMAQRLRANQLPMIEFTQSVPNLTESSTNLYELIKSRNLAVHADSDIRLAISRAVALETSRGWRIAKEKQSHKIDVVVALAMSALGSVRQGQQPQPGEGITTVRWVTARWVAAGYETVRAKTPRAPVSLPTRHRSHSHYRLRYMVGSVVRRVAATVGGCSVIVCGYGPAVGLKRR
jgi:phage terminase large subunit-like protein